MRRCCIVVHVDKVTADTYVWAFESPLQYGTYLVCLNVSASDEFERGWSLSSPCVQVLLNKQPELHLEPAVYSLIILKCFVV
jgi:hypothetical protein